MSKRLVQAAQQKFQQERAEFVIDKIDEILSKIESARFRVQESMKELAELNEQLQAIEHGNYRIEMKEYSDYYEMKFKIIPLTDEQKAEIRKAQADQSAKEAESVAKKPDSCKSGAGTGKCETPKVGGDGSPGDDKSKGNRAVKTPRK